MIDLQSKTIAITGASSGIGAATAIACARAGMNVAIGARRTDKLETVAELCREAGARAGKPIKTLVRELDVTKPQQCEEFVRAAHGELGGLYSVYANAGYGIECPVYETTDAAMRDIFEVNFYGTLNVIRPAIDLMLAGNAPASGPRGHVLICSSCVAKMTLPHYGAYSATKAAQCHIGRAMRLEMEPLGVQVSTVHPIGTSTEFFGQVKVKSGTDELAQHTPSWFMQTPEFVADKTVACLRRPRPEVWTGVLGLVTRLGMSVNTLLPFMADLTTRGMARRKHARAQA